MGQHNLKLSICNFQFEIPGVSKRRGAMRLQANGTSRLFKSLFAALAVFLSGTVLPVLAQCPMCRASLEGSPEAAAATNQMNTAVLVLLIPPVAMFVGMFVLIYRYRNYHRSHPAEESPR